MDTVEVKVIVRNDIIMEEVDLLKEPIAYARSRYGHNCCTILEEARNNEKGLIIKRYFRGNNAFLITRKSECLEVQEDFINLIKKNIDINNIVICIQLTRIDIPFTYLMKDDTDFIAISIKYLHLFIIVKRKKLELKDTLTY